MVGLFEAVNRRDFAAASAGYAEDAVLLIHADLGVIENTAKECAP